MSETGEYQLHVLGMFKLQRGAQVVTLPRRKAATLFSYLALHPQKHSRDELATLLWGDYLDDEARQSLRTALTSLRHALGDDIFITDKEAIRLNPTFPLWVDALSFESYAKRFLAEPPFDLSTSFIALYEGDLLPHLYDDWVVAERERLHSLYIEVLLRMAEQMRSRSKYQRALEFAQRVLTTEPSNERAHQHKMFCYIALGDRSAALKQYEICQRSLRDDLGVEPMPETQSLYRWIRGQPAHAPSKEAHITNLPLPLTSFVGREREMAEIKRLLAQHRLVTLTGPGGSGKTRLAIQLATDLVDRFKDGVWFVDLAGAQNASLVAQAVVQAVGAHAFDNRSMGESVVPFLRSRHILILLDNCERVIAACAQLADAILSSCPKVTILATSREPLSVMGEVVWSVPLLSTPAAGAAPPSLAALAGFEATHLFIQRATATYPDISLDDQDAPAVAVVCRQLDGLPLAIELAAARARVLSVRQIAEHLHDCFGLLASGSRSAPPRHKSLRATIDWSYNLLSPDEQALLRRLSVFASNCSLPGATAVYGEGRSESETLDSLAGLVEKSLVLVEQGVDEKRYRLLETIKLYAWEKLAEAGEKDGTIDRYITFYCAWPEELWDMPASLVRQRMDGEQYNIQRAVEWCRQAGDVQRGVSLLDAMWGEFTRWGSMRELLDWVDIVLARVEALSPAWQARAFILAARLARRRPDFALAFALAQRGLAAARASEDQKLICWAMIWSGKIACHMGNYVVAAAILAEARQLDLHLVAPRRFCAEQGALQHTDSILLDLAEALTRLGDYDQALLLWEQGLASSIEHDSAYGVPHGTAGLGLILLGKGDYPAAAQRFKESLALGVKYDHKSAMAQTLDMLALVATAQGQAERAAVLWGAADAAHAAIALLRSPIQQADYESAAANVRQRLGNQAFDKAYGSGQAMTLEQTVAYALGEV